jgi:hypothetical protein
MTAEVARLSATAGWEIPLLRGAVATLTAVAGRLLAWRIRVEAVGRGLAEAECWSGPAAQEAADVVLRLSTVAVGVEGGLRHSLEAFERLVAEAAAAAEVARMALLLPGPGWTEQALAHAARASAAAEEAGAALAGLGVVDAFGPASFEALTASVGARPVTISELPQDLSAGEVAAWWTALSARAQLAAIQAHPAAIGALDGIPAWARDRANRLLLRRALCDDGLTRYEALTARAVDRRLTELDQAGRPAQLHTLDLDGDRVAVALGDLDTADAVAVLVPGVLTAAFDDLCRLTRTGAAVASAVRRAAPGRTVAALVWLGYRAPREVLTMATRAAARRGGPALAGDLDGLAAARTAVGRPPARTTVIAHSYGTVVVDEAADVAGRLAADAVVLLGSPGMQGDAADLESPEVYAGASAADPISWLGWFGDPPSWGGFGATALPAEATTGHSDWFDADRPTLAAVGRVVAEEPAGREPP